MKVIAHRGASGYEPENTLLAIEAAIIMEVDMIEIDVHRVENELVVIHDRWLDKTTDGIGRLKDISFKQLREFDAGKGQKIPTLWEVLKLVHRRCPLNIELKSENTVDLLLDNINRACAELLFTPDQFLISSFNHWLLKETKQKCPNMKVGALTASLPLNYAQFARELDAYSLHADVDMINQSLIDDAHAKGIQVFVYTVDKPEDIDDLVQLGVDGIFTNFPTRAIVKLAHRLS